MQKGRVGVHFPARPLIGRRRGWIRPEPTEAQSCNYTGADGLAAGLSSSRPPSVQADLLPLVLQAPSALPRWTGVGQRGGEEESEVYGR